MQKPDRRAVTCAALLAVLVLGAVLRFADLDASLWGDEVSTYLRAKAPVGYSLAQLTTPLHEILVHYSIQIADNEVFLRLPGILAGLATIILIYFVARSLGGPGAGLLASLLLATSTYHVFRGHEARYYTLMMLAGLLWIWLLTRCIARGGAGNWLAYFLTCFWGLLIHQFCIPFLVTMNAGAAVWLLASRTVPTFRERVVRLGVLVLCTTLGATGIVTVFIMQGRSPLELIASSKQPESNVIGADEEPRSSLEPEGPVRLSVGEYLGHVKELFSYRLPLGFGGVLLLLFLGCGLLAVFARPGPFAAIALAAFCLTPLPFLLLNVRHGYEDRYFCILLPIGLVLASVGMVRGLGVLAALCSARDSARTLWRGEEPVPPETRRLARVFVALALLALIPKTVSALQWYYEWQPEKDYKGMMEYMAQTMTPHDVIYYVDPDNLGVWHFRTTPRVYYWNRFLKDSESFLFSVEERGGPLTPSDLKALVAEFPESTIWFYALEDHAGDADELLNRVCPEVKRFNGILLWVLGEPTCNLIVGGGFEDHETTDVSAPADVQYVTGEEAPEGDKAIRILVETPQHRRAGFRVNTPPYAAPCDLRNPGFEIWKKEVLVGWNPRAKSLALVRPATDAHSGKIGLELKEAPEPVAVVQRLNIGLAPGNGIEVSAWGKAAQPKQLHLDLVYRRQDQVERKSAYHPGGGNWAPVTLREKVPPDMDWDSLAVEVGRDPGSTGSVFVDDVQAALQGLHDSLDPQKTYTLSLMIRYENLRSSYETSNAQDAASVLLAFKRPDGQDEWVHAADFYGTRDWDHLEFQIKPGRDVPVGASWLLVSVALYGTGTLWVDNVQLEAKDHSTPFVEGVRPPHDEWVARVLSD